MNNLNPVTLIVDCLSFGAFRKELHSGKKVSFIGIGDFHCSLMNSMMEINPNCSFEDYIRAKMFSDKPIVLEIEKYQKEQILRKKVMNVHRRETKPFGID